jgi:hypothetical protein
MYLNVQLLNAQKLVVAREKPFKLPKTGTHIQQHKWFGNVG